MKMHEFELTIYNEDIDYTSVVYHPNYLKFMERARLNWFDSMGFGLEQQKAEGIFYVIRDIHLMYAKPARMDERLKIRTQVEVVGRAKAKLQFHQEIDNLTRNQAMITSADILVVCVNQSIKPRSLPDSILEKLNG